MSIQGFRIGGSGEGTTIDIYDYNSLENLPTNLDIAQSAKAGFDEWKAPGAQATDPSIYYIPNQTDRESWNNTPKLIDGKISLENLPIEVKNFVVIPIPESGSPDYAQYKNPNTLYLDLNDFNKIKYYDTSSTSLVTVANLLELGVSSNQAYRGDYGNIAYDHSQMKNSGNIHNVNPHAIDATTLGLKVNGTYSFTSDGNITLDVSRIINAVGSVNGKTPLEGGHAVTLTEEDIDNIPLYINGQVLTFNYVKPDGTTDTRKHNMVLSATQISGAVVKVNGTSPDSEGNVSITTINNSFIDGLFT